MLVIPAIDIRQGRCVRLFQGNPAKETVYGEDPVEVARQWERLGARMLHLVDLDGAFSGRSQNAELVAAIGEAVTVPLQLGGGIRTREAAEKAFSVGISRIILGTAAVDDPKLVDSMAKVYGERIVVGIDARDGQVAVKGWVEDSTLRAVELAAQIESLGVGEIIYTDINKDGTLEGPDLKGLEEIMTGTGLKIIVSGGISSLEDLETLKPYGDRIKGVIIGKALYVNQFSLGDAMAVFNSKS